jgi:hypothetical protein
MMQTGCFTHQKPVFNHPMPQHTTFNRTFYSKMPPSPYQTIVQDNGIIFFQENATPPSPTRHAKLAAGLELGHASIPGLSPRDYFLFAQMKQPWQECQPEPTHTFNETATLLSLTDTDHTAVTVHLSY